MEIREASADDAAAMGEVLDELVAAGRRTKPADADFVLSHYVRHPQRLHCFVALNAEGRILGFQSLKLAHEGNPYGTPSGWGIVGTHIRPSAVRSGIGSLLFAETLKASRNDKLPFIEAFIGEENVAALAYYDAMGFRTYRSSNGAICKSIALTEAADERPNRIV